jgi:glycosyltransferase involved in cell wall biosynthesis
MKLIISIIIPTYNREKYISQTLDSVKAQSLVNWECIIVDDGSIDETEILVQDYIKSDSRFLFFKRPKTYPKGANACRNYGFKLSKGDYILFLDSDDIIKNTCLEKRLSLFNTSKNIDFVIANSSYLKDSIFYNKPICEFPINYASEDYLKLFLRYKLPWTIMSVLWKKKIIEGFEFDEGLARFQDVDYHITILSKRAYNIIRLNEVDTYYRVEDHKILNQNRIISVINSLYYFLRKHIDQEYIQKRYPNCFKRFIIYFLIDYLYPNYKNHKLKIKEIESVIKKSMLFNNKELFFLRVKKFLIINNLIQKTGIGMNRLSEFLKKGLKYG